MLIKSWRITIIINNSALTCLNTLITYKVTYDIIFAFKDLFPLHPIV
jgi:hypothetical protein